MIQWKFLKKALKAIKGNGRIRQVRQQDKGPYGVEGGRAEVYASVASINAWYRR